MKRLIPLVLLFATLAHAENDPYKPEARMPAGPFAGQPLDVSTRRPMVKLSADEQGNVVVANFFHEGKFWIAKIPTGEVESISFISERMKGWIPAAHSELRFKFKAGSAIELSPQDGGAPPRVAKLTDMITSTEAVFVAGQKYDLVAGMLDHFALATRATSLDTLRERAAREGNQLNEIPIGWPARDGRNRPIDPTIANGRALRNAIDTSHADGLRHSYHTLFRSCHTEALRFLDEAIVPGARQRLGRMLRSVPIFPKTYLCARGFRL